MNYIYWLSQIQHAEQSLVGNQLYVLSQLLQQDYPILPGFVLSNSSLRQFLTESADFQSLIKDLSNSSFSLDVKDPISLQSIASRSRQIIDRSGFPSEIEREISQAIGELNSDCIVLQPFLSFPDGKDIVNRGFWRSHTCNIHPQALTETIKAVWSELFTANSLVYRDKFGLGGQTINLNILVRPLKQARASGVVEIDADLIKIEAVWGQEQSLVRGDVESDKYYLDRYTGRVLCSNLGRKNYGYRIKQFSYQTPLVDCLAAYIPEEKHTAAYVLDNSAISQLFQLTKDILQQQPRIKYFSWTIPQDEFGSSSDFAIARLGDNLSTSIDFFAKQTAPILLSSTNKRSLLTGIPASPGKTIGKVVAIDDFKNLSPSILADSILVIKELPVERIHSIEGVKGIIIETGGKTSHGAIVARELNIPAVVNAVDAMSILTNGAEVFLDGDEGMIYPATAVRELPLPDFSTDYSSFHPESIATKLMVNISQPQSIANSLNLPIDGIGLLRSELMMGHMLGDKSSSKWQSPSFQAEFSNNLKESIEKFLTAFAPRPVFYRSLDWSEGDTTNSILGDRGTYNYQFDRSLFSLELKVLSDLVACGHDNLNLILPFVRSVEEFKFCYRLLENIGLIERESFQVWIMAEVPSSIWLLPEYIKAGVQGIAIGTNDLTQLLLGVDREKAHFSQHGLNANHTVVQQAIAKLIAIAREHDIECCICGQAPVEYPDLIDKLVRWGVTTISVEPKAVKRTHKAIARAERRILLDSLKFK